MEEDEQQHLIEIEVTPRQNGKRFYELEHGNKVYALATIGYLDPHIQYPIVDPCLPCIPVETHFMGSDSEGAVACDDNVYQGQIDKTRLAKLPGKDFSLNCLPTAFYQAGTFPRFCRSKRRIGPN